MHNKFIKKCCIVVLVFTMFATTACSNKNKVESADNNIISIENSNLDNNENKETNNSNDDENVENSNNNSVDKENGNQEQNADIEIVESYLDENNVVTNEASIEVVVNKERNLPSDYVPSDLIKLTDVPTCLSNPEINQLRKEAAEALTELFSKAKEETGIQLYARSGYRSYNTQVSLYNGYVENHGQDAADKFSAKPGQSEHQTGLALDITSDSVNLQLTEDFGETEEGKWICENAHNYGFIVRYPEGKEEVTGYMYEPWHIRYVGKDLATKVYESGKTLDEYMFGE